MSNKLEKNFVLGFLLGIGLGVAFAGLSAPATGPNLRKKLSQDYQGSKESLEESLLFLLESLRETSSKIIEQFESLSNQGASILVEDEII